MTTKDLSYYLDLKYPVTFQESPGGGYFVTHPDLDGCMAEGATLEEAIANLADSRELWIETRLANGFRVPEPGASSATEYSGRISLRMVPSLHEHLARIADRRDVSLNLLINTVLASYAGGEDALYEARNALAEMLEQASTSRVLLPRNAAASEKRLRR